MRSTRKSSKDDSSKGNEVTLVRGGKNFFTTLERLINEAKYFIHFQTYIFEDDQTGKKIQEALIRAAGRNVKVYLLLDAYGSLLLPIKFIEEMKSAGISFHFFGPLISGWSFHLGRRMHHKVVVADGVNSLVGGINISDRYNDLSGNVAWLDFAILCRGPVSLSLLRVCLHRWTRKRIKTVPDVLKKIFDSNYHEPTHGYTVVVRENDALRNKTQINTAYKKAIRSATKEIIIVGGYFIPGYRFRRLMKAAANRGVKIKILSGGKSDVGLAMYARRFLYSWMFQYQFEIYEYKKTVVHGKVAVIDGQWTTIGSYDLNNLSAYSNIELNVEIHSNSFSEKVRGILLKIIEEDCVQITAKNFLEKIHWLSRVRLWASYRITRFLFSFSRVMFASTDD